MNKKIGSGRFFVLALETDFGIFSVVEGEGRKLGEWGMGN
jgi:hypothetical protein